MSPRNQSITKRNAARPVRKRDWTTLNDRELLEVRICDLDLRFDETPLVAMRDRLYGELASRDIRLKPHCWLSDDWFSPDGIPGIAVPFYLAHPRLMRLERRQMLEVEGGTQAWCMRILRHEAGHAVDTAFRLHRRKAYKSIFGNYHSPYPEYYRPKPRSKNFVMHLEPWYAQSHPAEDFAETFAVWLKPRSRWRSEYEGWKAIKKIEFVDELMTRIGKNKAQLKSRAKIDPAHRINKTLKEHYAERHARYSLSSPSVFDDDLDKLFPQTPESRRSMTAAAFLRKNRTEFARTIAQWTGEYRYNINQVLRELIDRCKIRKLRVSGDEIELKQNLMIILTVQTMNYVHRGHRVAL